MYSQTALMTLWIYYSCIPQKSTSKEVKLFTTGRKRRRRPRAGARRPTESAGQTGRLVLRTPFRLPQIPARLESGRRHVLVRAHGGRRYRPACHRAADAVRRQRRHRQC